MASQSRLAFRSGSDAKPDGVGDPDSEREPTGGGYDKRHLSTPTFGRMFCSFGLARQELLSSWLCACVNEIDAWKERIYTADFGRQARSVGQC